MLCDRAMTTSCTATPRSRRRRAATTCASGTCACCASRRRRALSRTCPISTTPSSPAAGITGLSAPPSRRSPTLRVGLLSCLPHRSLSCSSVLTTDSAVLQVGIQHVSLRQLAASWHALMYWSLHGRVPIPAPVFVSMRLGHRCLAMKQSRINTLTFVCNHVPR